MTTPLHALILLAVLLVWCGQAGLAGWIANGKGRSFGLYFAAGLIVGPIVVFASLLLPRRRII
jgi:hypothetical protein